MSPTTASATASRTRRPLIRRRPLAWGIVLLLLASVAIVIFNRGGATPPGDPDVVSANGARALHQVAQRQGARIQTVRSVAELRAAQVGPSTTILVTDAAAVSRDGVDALAATDPARLILTTPSPEVLTALDVPARPVGATRGLLAQCTSEFADPEDTLIEGVLYRPTAPDATVCFRAEEGGDTGDDTDDSGLGDEDAASPAGALLDLPADGARPRTIVLGHQGVLLNGQIGRASHAALALRLLGDDIVWFVPSPEDGPPTGREPGSAPTGEAPAPPAFIMPAIIIVALTLALLCLWRGRRLGPLVTEPLPVIVPADELSRARARLYRTTGDPAAAAAVLRDAAVQDMSGRLRLRDASPDRLDQFTEAVAAAVDEPPEDVHATFTRAVPDAAALHDLDRELRRLRRKVRTT
ncbi:MAG: hypothetical protein Q4G43_14475 [Mobilicoccus sp.]|nr:hypothetical protein [Mobilicoccus sp.]